MELQFEWFLYCACGQVSWHAQRDLLFCSNYRFDCHFGCGTMLSLSLSEVACWCWGSRGLRSVQYPACGSLQSELKASSSHVPDLRGQERGRSTSWDGHWVRVE